ncbi:hypothetical protein SASC598J21_000910, partial [Snodgrassella alvi SCGC AB-598-J21]
MKVEKEEEYIHSNQNSTGQHQSFLRFPPDRIDILPDTLLRR